MKPEPFNGANLMIKSPPNWPAEHMGYMYDVPVTQKNGLVLSVWRPNDHELALLNGGGVVLVTQVTPNPCSQQVEVMPTSTTTEGMARA